MVKYNRFSAFRRLKYRLGRNKVSRRRLELEQQEPQGGKGMIKGLSKRIVVVKNPDSELFEEAIFVVREDALRKGHSSDVLQQAQKAANEYIKRNLQPGKFIIAKLGPPAYLAAGAAATGIAWLAVYIGNT